MRRFFENFTSHFHDVELERSRTLPVRRFAALQRGIQDDDDIDASKMHVVSVDGKLTLSPGALCHYLLEDPGAMIDSFRNRFTNIFTMRLEANVGRDVLLENNVLVGVCIINCLTPTMEARDAKH